MIMSQIEIAMRTMLYIYIGMCVLTFIYNRQTTIQKDRYWQGLFKPLIIMSLWPIVISFLIVCYVPIFLSEPIFGTMVVLREVFERKTKSLRR